MASGKVILTNPLLSDPVVICPEQAAYELAKMFDIPFTQMYAVGIGETHEFPDFTLYTMHGSHMPQAFIFHGCHGGR